MVVIRRLSSCQDKGLLQENHHSVKESHLEFFGTAAVSPNGVFFFFDWSFS